MIGLAMVPILRADVDPMTIVAVALAILAIVFAYSTIKVVSQGKVKVIERLGRFHKLAEGGLNIIVPFVDTVRVEHDLRDGIKDIETQPVITRDNVTMNVNCVVFWRVIDAFRATYEVSNVEQAVEQVTLSALRNAIGELDLDHTLTSRDLINTKMRTIIDSATDKWGVKVTRVEMKNIEPPPEIKHVMEKQMTAERSRRAIVTEAEGEKSSAILKAEGQKQSAIVAAEGQREAAINRAEGEATALVRVAQGEAKAIQTIAEAFAGKTNPAGYLVALKYIEALRELSKGANKTVFLPYEATGVLSSLGGMKELLKSIEKG